MRIIVGIFVAVFVTGCAASPASFRCASSDPDFCKKEIKAHYEIRKLELQCAGS